MPGQRPYHSHSLDSLFRLAKEHWEHVHFLQVILDELGSRTTPAARQRHAEIAARVAQLRQAGGSDPDAAEAARELTRLRADRDAARRRVVELEASLRRSEDTILGLRRALSAASPRAPHPVFRRVGLDESCPDFVLKAVRTAYRKRLHPDTRPDHEKAQAEARFKEAESVFDTIYALRKL